MSNKKLIIGVAAGVATLAVVGIILKRKGYLDGIIEKAEGYGEEIAEKYKSVKETARQKFDEAIQKGTEIADRIKSGESTSAAINNATANQPTA
ncbi:hypothetical protein GR160_14755 [Flavobacterium sp. Sd200]|uniref:hypothetical protein n=1 Tax=Flavobacterium sp. Sd200 TaxID=2692211 RepID=UPI0013683CFE|nr:hypothetical protein [Flavobacterium sp. Sd200]MXN92487.1 hypothetical protein [Flavobacterium sp. Sd200]